MKIMKHILMGLTLTMLTATVLADGFGVNGQQATSQAARTQAVDRLLAEAQQASATNNSTAARAPVSAATKTASNTAASAFGPTRVSQEAFAKMVRNMMPLTPTQIRTLRVLFDQSQRAAAAYPGTPPKPTSSSVLVNLSPGAAPPIVRLRQGYVTSLVFIDATGAPWPITAYDLGDPKGFNIQWNKKGNTLLVQALDRYKSGNLAVMLKGEDTPVMITLMPGQRAVDYRVDLRLPGLGPNASPTLSTVPDNVSPQLLNFLDGVPPNGAKELTVDGGQCQAWLFGGHLYLRTLLTVLSPSWLSTMSSPDGTNVYELTKAPIILASDRGKIIQLHVEGL